MSQTLAPVIVEELTRLGATIKDEPQPLDFEDVPVPEPIRQLIADVNWPGGTTYSDPQTGEPWARHVQFGEVCLFAEQDLEGIGMDLDYLEEDGMNMCPWADKFNDVLVLAGSADNGGYLLMLDLEDDDPADPQVYHLNHDDPDQFFDDLQGEALSSFLKRLIPEQ
jgi:hypothetical protein